MVNNKYGKCLFSVDSRAAPPTTHSVAVDGKYCKFLSLQNNYCLRFASEVIQNNCCMLVK